MKYFHFVHIFIFFSVVTDSTAGFSGDDIRQEIISELKDYFGGEIETIKANHESEIKALKEELDDNNKGMKELKGELYNERRERIQAMLKLSKLSKKYSILQKETRDLRLQLDTVRHEQTKALDELRDELEVQKKTPSEEATDNQDSLKYSVEQQSVVPGFTQQSSMDLESLKHTGKPKAERKLIANHKGKHRHPCILIRTFSFHWYILQCLIPAEYNVETTSYQRHDVTSTLMRHCINVMYPLGWICNRTMKALIRMCGCRLIWVFVGRTYHHICCRVDKLLSKILR